MKTEHGQLALTFPVQDTCHFGTFVTELLNKQLLYSLTRLAEDAQEIVFLWGVEGSGKTHLLQALCHQTESSIYLPIADLLQYPPTILDGMETLELVCVDDVHLLAGQSQWQEALFVLFNRLREQGRKLVVTSALPPQSLPLELADLHSRLQWGLVFQVQELSDGGKAQVLQQAAELRGIELSDELVDYIFQRSERNLKSLFAVLDRLDALSLIEKRRITQPFIRQIMGW